MTKVLYVEDNDDNVFMLKMRLELLGDFEVLHVVHDVPLLLLNNGMTARLCRQTKATSLGQILIVLNRRDAPINER